MSGQSSLFDQMICEGSRSAIFSPVIGGWSRALRLAGWPDDVPVWTGSCPCQPWSDANVAQGGGSGAADVRHLWPVWRPLIIERGAPVVFGEQVASALRRGWWDEVCEDLEGAGYACASAVIPACAVGADHERKRLMWVADAGGERWTRRVEIPRVPVAAEAAHAVDGGVFTRARRALDGDYRDLLPCDGLSVVMERRALHGFGNAIVPEAAAAFISAYLEA